MSIRGNCKIVFPGQIAVAYRSPRGIGDVSGICADDQRAFKQHVRAAFIGKADTIHACFAAIVGPSYSANIGHRGGDVVHSNFRMKRQHGKGKLIPIFIAC